MPPTVCKSDGQRIPYIGRECAVCFIVSVKFFLFFLTKIQHHRRCRPSLAVLSDSCYSYNMMKTLNKLAGLVLVILAALSLTTCQTLSSVFREPVLSLHSVELANINFTSVTVLCKVNVENPNAITVPFPDIDWEFYINANSFIRGKIDAGQSIRARSTTVVDVPVSIDYPGIYNTFSSLKNSNQADYKIALAFKFALPIIGDKVWNFEHEGNFPLPKVPSISFKGISLKNLSLTKIDFDIVWEIENNNIFAMSVKDLSYNLTVNNTRWTDGRVNNSPQIAAGRKTEIPLTISINALSMVRDITEIITRGTNVAYQCGGNVSLGADLPGLDFNTPFNFSGSTRLRN